MILLRAIRKSLSQNGWDFLIERGITVLNYDPASSNKKIPVTEWLGMMGRTRHLLKEEYRSVTEEIQKEIDRRYDRLKARAEHPLL